MKNGFTLVEVLVVAAIISVIALLGYNFLAAGTRNYAKLKNETDLLNEKDKIFNEIFSAVKTSRGIISGSEGRMTMRTKDSGWAGEAGFDEYYAIEQTRSNLIINGRTVSDKIERLQFFFNKPPPETKHIIIRLKLLNYKEEFINSVCLRNAVMPADY